MPSRVPPIAAALAALAAALALAAPARAESELDTLNRAIEAYNDGRHALAAAGFYQVEESATVEEDRSKAEYYLAQSLGKLGLGFGAFFYYGQIIKAGPSHPYYFKAVEGALNVTEAYDDEVLGPSVLNKAYNDQFARLPAEALSRINYYIALLGYRAGRAAEAESFLQGVPPESSAYAQALYLAGLLRQRTEPEKALELFRSIGALADGRGYKKLAETKELADLALGRTLYGLRRYRESAEAYSRLPRFSRHWDEALFEGAYADLQNDDPGAALGRLHSLHSPHLGGEFAPESFNLAAILYHQNCLWPQVREMIARFDRDYLTAKSDLKRVLDSNPPLEQFFLLVGGGAPGLPPSLQHHLQKNERIASMLGYIGRLEQEAKAIEASPVLGKDPLGADLLELIGKQKGLVVQVAGKFIKGRLVDVLRLLTVLDGDKLIIGFETSKGERELLEQKDDTGARLAGQELGRPPMPQTGYEYWPFDGEYWPDEIGYYKYTLKSACPPRKKDE
jgi:hypothetical protein